MESQPETTSNSGFRSLQSSITAAFLLLVCFVLLFSTVLETYSSIQTQRQLIDKQHGLIAQEAAGKVSAFFDRIALRMKMLVRLHDPIAVDPAELHLDLEKLLGSESAIRHLLVLRADGTKLDEISRLSSLSAGALDAHIDSYHFGRVLGGETAFTPVYIDEVTSEPLIIVGVPAKNALGDTNAAMFAELNLKFIWTLVAELRIGDEGLAYLVDETGRLIAADDVNRVLSGERLTHLTEVQRFLGALGPPHEDFTDFWQRGFTGDYVVARHASLENQPWALVVETPVREAFSATIHKAWYSLLILALSLTLAVIAARYLATRVTKPIVSLRDATHRIAQGERSVRLDLRLKNEIGDLAHSFDHMVSVLDRTTVSRDSLAAEVSERRRAEEAAAEAKKQAEDASVAKSRFLANMSHELRTPLNAIIGFTTLLEDSKLDGVQRDYVSTVRGSGNVLLSLINDILDISKVEEGRLELERIPFEIEHVVETVLQIVRPRVSGSPIELIHDISDIPPWFLGDPTRVQQILLNLLSNAIKFTPRGRIAVDVRIDESDRKGAGHPGLRRTLRISVRDSGIGIPRDKLATIFEVFVQADTSTTRRFGGSGLGLAITKAFVERMGGRIWVESEPEQGSEFIFTLELEQCASPEQGAPDDRGSLSGRGVGIVTSNGDIAGSLRETCRREGLVVRFVSATGAEARKALQGLSSEEPSIDALLVDLDLPDQTGTELAEAIHGQDRWRNVRVIALTHDLLTEVAERDPFQGYVTRPVLRSELRSALAQALGGRESTAEADRDGTPSAKARRGGDDTLSGLRILVAEDNTVNLRLVRQLLERMGAREIEEASNGREALDAARRERFDLILMDVQMPEMNGLEATQAIREQVDAEVPIIALTAGALQEDRRHALDAGMTDFLTKPVDRTELRRVLVLHTSPSGKRLER
ncbi:MAG: response regulator [Candidatus Eisenbacteria bacterium]